MSKEVVWSLTRHGTLVGLVPSGPGAESAVDRVWEGAQAVPAGYAPPGRFWREDGPHEFGGSLRAATPVPETGGEIAAEANWLPWERPLGRDDLRADLAGLDWNSLSAEPAVPGAGDGA